MSANESSDTDNTSNRSDLLTDTLYRILVALRGSISLSVFILGVVFIALGGTVLKGVWAGLFAIFGLTAIGISVGGYSILWINVKR